jgi:hypothetical protein
LPGIWTLQLLLNVFLIPLLFSFEGLASQIGEFPRWTKRMVFGRDIGSARCECA